MKLSKPSLAGLAPLVWATYCHRLGAPTGRSCALATGSGAQGSPRTVGLGSGLGGSAAAGHLRRKVDQHAEAMTATATPKASKVIGSGPPMTAQSEGLSGLYATETVSPSFRFVSLLNM